MMALSKRENEIGCPSFWTSLKYFIQGKISNFPPIPAHGDDDGVFWIAFEDVLRYFDCIDICKVRRGWSETRVYGILPNHSSKQHQSCTLLTVLEPPEVEFSLFQEGQR